jgi:fructose-specific component phosphotransferase system IIB-like protein
MKKLFACAALVLISAFAFAQKSEEMKWMTGTWKINAGNAVIVEKWQIANDSTLNGKSVLVKNGSDTIPQETIQLIYRNGNWYYVPVAKGQNNDQPVSFKVIYLKGSEFVSENPSHDFPQRIAYRRIKSQLFASIEGKNKNRYAKQNFDFSTE